MSKSLISRYVWLVDTIMSAGYDGLTYKEISDKWENYIPKHEDYKLRTFMKHKTDIYELFGIEIKCHKRTNRYYIEDPKEVNNASGFKRWLFETLSVNNKIAESAKLKDRILLENNPSGRKFVTTILEAMSDDLMITFSYQPYWRDEPSNFYNFEPYALKVFRNRWYLLGKYGDNPLKVYALDRILDIDIEFNEFKIPEDFDASQYFNTAFGIIVDKEVEPQRVLLKVDYFQANYFRSLPIHHSQVEEERNEEYSIFSYFLRPAFDFVQEILSNAETVEVLQPKSLRQEIKNKAKEIAKLNK